MKIEEWKKSGLRKIGKLTLVSDPDLIRRMNDSVEWKCDCGNKKITILKSVLSGLTKSCGCLLGKQSSNNLEKAKTRVEHPSSYWKSKIPEIIEENLPDKWSAGSSKKVKFLCKCGHIYIRRFFKFKSGVSTCGRCFEYETYDGDKIGNVIYRGKEKKISKNSDSKDQFECPCGRLFIASIRLIFLGKQKSCAKCNVRDEKWWASNKFGKLSVAFPSVVSPLATGSEKTALWICSCGQEAMFRIDHVIKGAVKTCGSCSSIIKKWWDDNSHILRSLHTPIHPSQIPPGGPRALGTIRSLSSKESFICWSCGRKYETRMTDIISGKSLSCGCVSGKISNGNIEIRNFLLNLGFQAELEYPIQGYKYDVVVPNHRLVVEYNGLRWHSSRKIHTRDMKKYEIAREWGSILVFFEDEWSRKRKACENIIKERISFKETKTSSISIRLISNQEAFIFYEKWCLSYQFESDVNYGVFTDELIGCCYFKKISGNEWELLKPVSGSVILGHDIWISVLSKFISEFKPLSIMTYSDNRLSDENLYERLGFKFIKEQEPTKFVVCGSKRVISNSGISKPNKEIWDYGKKQWILKVGKDAKRKSKRTT